MGSEQGQKALLILGLSSLDSYTDRHGLCAGEELAYILHDVMEKWAGPVFITDQGWEDCGRVSRPRMSLEEALKPFPGFVRFPFDEDVDDWEESMQRLARLLRSRHLRDLVLGGLWATADGSSGGVNEAARLLGEQGFACRIDYSICGLDEDGEEGRA